MPLDTAKIDAQIKKLQELRRIVADPEMAPLLESLIAQDRNGNRLGTSPKPSAAHSNQSTLRRGDVIRAASKAAATFSGRFKADEVLDVMQQAGFRFVASNPIVAVNSALRRLVKRQEIRIAQRGTGRIGHKYERVNKALGD